MKFFLRISIFTIVGLSALQAVASDTYSVTLEKSRLVINNKKESELRVTNPTPRPVLIQSRVYSEDKVAPAPFKVVPPLFKLDALDTSILRVIKVSEISAVDRESMYWLCVKAIPPTLGEEEQADSLQVGVKFSVSRCVKVFYRPQALVGMKTKNLFEKVSWSRVNDGVLIKNNSPYYLNFSALEISGVKVSEVFYVPPFEEKKIVLADPISKSDVLWSLLNDFGEAEHYTSKLD
ncbi:molecular chaperone [Pseudomonas sp. RC4D1]|uniref:fimbrial biogenesis chaperone n=1 Tax=Pseudomonas sp. RC4D1 TaxID=2834407 RepID=UPI001BCD9B51|nr:molecular chaperone [Pseudomonas sp. RC4D1]MBS7560098.1 molecular chaperone [Pseudomonas sp. RC4D1]